VIFDPATHTVHAAGRTWQADPDHTSIEDLEGGGFDGRRFLHRSRRCLVRFETGWAASIVWGTATYSSNHDQLHADDPFAEQPALVEVGVLDHTGQLRMRRHTDDDGYEWHDLEAYLDDAGLAALLEQLAGLPTDHDYGTRPPTLDGLRQTYDTYRDAARAAGHDVPDWPDP
jgi:hypothetical protein